MDSPPTVLPCPCCDIGGLDYEPCPSRARITELETVLKQTGAWPCVGGDTPAEDFLECRWCLAHTHTAEEKAEAIIHWPDCRLVKLGLVATDSPGGGSDE